MTKTPTTWRASSASGRPGRSEDLLRTLDAAFAWTKTARHLTGENVVGNADERLRDAIDAARDAGVAWGAIGDVLGIARGNAYQRYRKRSSGLGDRIAAARSGGSAAAIRPEFNGTDPICD